MIPLLTGLLIGFLAGVSVRLPKLIRFYRRAKAEGFIECYFKQIENDKRRMARDRRFTETRKRMAL